MKHIITLLQVFIWLFIDTMLFIYYLEWNLYMYRPTWNGFIKQKNGIVRRANNSERLNKQYKNKYSAAFSF